MNRFFPFSLAAALPLLAAAASDPLSFPSYTQTLQVQFASAEDAQNAKLRIAPLPDGKKVAFTTRWDDSSNAHVDKAKMLNAIGYKGTFFVNGNSDFLTQTAPKLLAGKNALGNHSSNHPMLMEADTATLFREILENRKRIETLADTTVVSFAMPYNWGSNIDPARPCICAQILVDTGHYVSGDGALPTEASVPPLPGKTLPKRPSLSVFMPAHLFSADDTNPKPEKFNPAYEENFQKALENSWMPRISFGIHSWCNAEGNKIQSDLLQARGGNPDIYYCSDNEYGAYRYSALYGSAVPAPGMKGATRKFILTRFDPALLGDDVPLSISFVSPDGKPVSPRSVSLGGKTLPQTERGMFTIPHAADYALPEAVYEAAEDGFVKELPGLRFRLVCKNNTLHVSFENQSGKTLRNLYLVSCPTPVWSAAKNRYTETLPELPSGKAIQKSYPLGKMLPELTTATPEYYAAHIDFAIGNKHFRVWCDFTAPEKPRAALSSSSALTPQATARTLGPFEIGRLSNEAITAFSRPETVLPNLGLGLHEYWRSQANPGGAPWSVNSFIPWKEDKAFIDPVRDFVNAQKSMRLVAFDFASPQAGDLELRTNLLHYRPNQYWVNGQAFAPKKGNHFKIPVRKGWNRIIINAPLPNAYHATSFLAAVFLPDGSVAPCRIPASQLRENTFTGELFSGEFSPAGELRTLSCRGVHLVDFVSFTGDFDVYQNGEKTKTKWQQTAAGKGNAKFIRNADDSLSCLTEFPVMDPSGEALFRYRQQTTLRGKSVTFEGCITLARDLSWTGKLLELRIQWPETLFAGSSVSGTMNRNAFSRTFSEGYDHANNLSNLSELTIRSEKFPPLHLTMENTSLSQILDRRQWKQKAFSAQLHPKGTLLYGNTPCNDPAGKTYTWKVTFEISE